MSKHTIEIAERPVRLSLKNGQLIITQKDLSRSFACEDVGILILQHPAISLSAAVLDALLSTGAAVLICGENRMPSGLLLPTVAHSELVPRMTAQMQAPLPARKQSWKAIIQAKIRAQAEQVPDPAHTRLLHLANGMKSGDPDNREAQAAKIYWSAHFPQEYAAGDSRDPDGTSRFNLSLNYGYSILRASLARALVVAGLQPALGVFHHRRNNPFCLADDLIEPLRPLVDRTVSSLLQTSVGSEPESLNVGDRRALLAIPATIIQLDDHSGPLMAVLPRYVAGFFRHLTKESTHFPFPRY